MSAKSIGIWGLREEARERWDHVVNNFIVYLPQSLEGHLECAHVLAKKYLDGDIWFDLHWTGVDLDQRELHYHAIVEFSALPIPVDVDRERYLDRITVGRNGSVFVEVPEFIDLPESVIPVGVPSEVRLERIKNICDCGWKHSFDVGVGLLVCGIEDRKCDPLLLSSRKHSGGVQVCEIPCQLIQSGSETTDEVSSNERDVFRYLMGSNGEVVPIPFKIIMLQDGVRWSCIPLHDFSLKRFQMKVCPSGLHVDMI